MQRPRRIARAPHTALYMAAADGSVKSPSEVGAQAGENWARKRSMNRGS